MKKILLLFIISFIFIPKVYAKQIIEETHMESVIMLDVARRYYTVDEIKKYIDALSLHDNSTLQLHLTDDENVGIECTYLDQTKENATVSNGIYTNPITNKQFLTYDQVTELMNYAKEKNVNFIPEIDIPAHMRGFFVLAENKFGEDFVKHPYDWDNPINSGIAWGTGDEAGNLDLMSSNAKPFAKSLLDEYTEFFKNCNTFHMGFDEYTFRPEMKIDYANEIYEYLSPKRHKIPKAMFNIINGGMHSKNNLDIQEFMIVPKMESFKETLRCASEVFHSLKELLDKEGLNTSVGDEGGFAPNLENNKSALNYIVKAIESAGYKPGKDVFLACK